MTEFERYLCREISPDFLDTTVGRVAVAFSEIREQRRATWAKLAQAIAHPAKIRQETRYDRIRLRLVQYTLLSKWFPSKPEWEIEGEWRIVDDALRLMKGYYGTLH